MKMRDQARLARLDDALLAFSAERHPLPGVADAHRRRVLLEQLIDSLHRVEYPKRLIERSMSPRRADPLDAEYFDPIKAAAYHRSQGAHDEACWLIFLFVHFGARPAGNWRFIREIYGGLGEHLWEWKRVSGSPSEFGEWIEEHTNVLRRPGPGGGFGNHRKYETLGATERVVRSYVNWVGEYGHAALFARAEKVAVERGGDVPRTAFDALYHSMAAVWRFGRLAKFDYLSMIGKLDLAFIEPGSTYMEGATGPTSGARLLFAGDSAAEWPSGQLEELLHELEGALGVGMQALEDAICNWQKDPDRFIHFGG